MTAVGLAVSEMLGTGVLLVIGTGLSANRTLRGLPGNGGGWLLVCVGWGFAVFAGASVASASGGQLNPAVTVAEAVAGNLPWSHVPWYVGGQLVGAVAGALLAYLAHKPFFDRHDDHADSVAIFATGPALPDQPRRWSLVTEVIATFVLVLYLRLAPGISGDLTAGGSLGNGALGYAAVAFVIIAIGAGLGGPTGYALNPARDLGPRLVYAVLRPRLRGAGGAEWGYAWVPVLGPLVGAVAAVGVASLVA